jgi:polysaccharide pyruvyl transferase WcaK-like protein
MAGSQGRIFLLSPYSGGNLGDQAIQFSFVQNLRQRRPSLEFIGVTEKPAATAVIHGIPCVPISLGVARATPGKWLHLPDHGGAPAGSRLGPVSPAPAAAPRSALWRTLTGPVRLLRRAGRLAGRLAGEVVFAVRAAGLLRRGDLLLVAGGGQIDDTWGGPWAHPFAMWKWTALARLRGCRVAVASVGWSDLGAALSRRFFDAALKRACYRSYRDRGSVDRAVASGLPDRGLCVPDNAFGLQVAPGLVQSSRGSSAATVGLSPIAFGRSGTWPTVDAPVYARYIDEYSRFAAALTREGRGVKVFTTSRMDRHAVEEMRALMRDTHGARMDQVEIVATDTLAELLATLAGCGLVVASRLHGVILAHRLGIPTLAISFDRKVDAHMEDVGQSRFCLDIRKVDCAGLLRDFATLESSAAAMRQQLLAYVDARQKPLAKQYDILASLVTGH